MGLLLVLCASALVAFAAGCRRDSSKPGAPPEPPTLRLYVFGGAAAAIEPCGCVKDMLGGVDHAAAWLAAEKKKAPHALLVGSGPMFFADPELAPKDRDQAAFKADTLALALKDTGLVAWAPGANDFALGPEKFRELVSTSGATPLAGNLRVTGQALAGHQIVRRGGLVVGLVGASVPKTRAGAPSVVEIADAEAALVTGRDAARAAGAELVVGLVAAERGLALRLAEKVEGFQVLVVGKGFDEGENNDAPFPPELVGQTLVVQGPNHLQGIAVVDLFVRGGQLRFADGSGIARAAERESLRTRADELRRRIANWEAPGSGVKPEELASRRADLSKLDADLARLTETSPPAQGSYFLYDFVFVKEDLGVDGAVAARLSAYYQRVNEHNRTLFADKTPPPVPAGGAGYVGIDKCSSCHEEERKFWDTTAHARAYETLAKDHKQFNLDCVSCHVTGYEQPGGSTVTHVAGLTDVQCEVCHGPGSRHVESPLDKEWIRRTPDINLCASSCHHPPHVNADWSVGEAWSKIIGPGHGR